MISLTIQIGIPFVFNDNDMIVLTIQAIEIIYNIITLLSLYTDNNSL